MARQQETGCQTRKKSQIPADAEKKQAGSFSFLYKEKNILFHTGHLPTRYIRDPLKNTGQNREYRSYIT